MRLEHRTIFDEPTVKGREMAEEAIEALCQDFCNPKGHLSPRLINPNPNIVFAVSVNRNSMTDDMFLRKFVEKTARYSMAGAAENSIDTPAFVDALASLAPFDLATGQRDR